MRTTIRLDDALLERARREAARRHQTLTALIEQGLREVLRQAHTPRHRKRVTLPVSKNGGGTLPGVDLANNSALLDVMEGRW
jgi:ribonuclease PH